MVSKGPRAAGDNRPPDEGDRLIRWAEEMGLKVHVYEMDEAHVIVFNSFNVVVDQVTVWKPEPWEPVLRSYLEGEAERQAEGRALARGGLM